MALSIIFRSTVRPLPHIQAGHLLALCGGGASTRPLYMKLLLNKRLEALVINSNAFRSSLLSSEPIIQIISLSSLPSPAKSASLHFLCWPSPPSDRLVWRPLEPCLQDLAQTQRSSPTQSFFVLFALQTSIALAFVLPQVHLLLICIVSSTLKNEKTRQRQELDEQKHLIGLTYLQHVFRQLLPTKDFSPKQKAAHHPLVTPVSINTRSKKAVKSSTSVRRSVIAFRVGITEYGQHFRFKYLNMPLQPAVNRAQNEDNKNEKAATT